MKLFGLASLLESFRFVRSMNHKNAQRVNLDTIEAFMFCEWFMVHGSWCIAHGQGRDRLPIIEDKLFVLWSGAIFKWVSNRFRVLLCMSHFMFAVALSRKKQMSKHDFRTHYLCETSDQRAYRLLFLVKSVNPVVLEFS